MAMQEVELADSRPTLDEASAPENDAHNRYDEQQPLVSERLPKALRIQRDFCAACVPKSTSGVWSTAAAVATLLVTLAGCLLYFGAAGQTSLQPQDSSTARPTTGASLYDSLRPESYDLTLSFTAANFEPDASTASTTFAGTCRVAFLVTEAANSVVLHSVGLNFSHVQLQSVGRDSVCLCGPGCSSQTCERVVTAARAAEDAVQIDLGGAVLPPGSRALLDLHYTGHFSPNSGIYRSAVYRDETGAGAGVLLVTQLEAIGARHALPCVDEPQAKAVFTTTLEFPAGLAALANTPAVGPSQLLADGRRRQQHQATPIMSPYLLALAVGNISSLSTVTESGLDVAVWSVPRLQSQLHLPLQFAVDALEFYTAWTGVHQPLSKFDLVAVPGKSGAMENWGLLLFDERRFLWFEETEGAYGQWLAADVICHELAHQWFGNLATCRDWAHLTVNEGLASFMEYLCVEAVLPGADAAVLRRRASSPMGESIGVHEGPQRVALQADAEPLAVPLVPDLAAHPLLLPSGQITYSKGASLLLMLQAFVDAAQPSSFQSGLQNFLQSFAYNTATVDDLVSAIMGTYSAADAEKDALTRQITEWFYRPGFPLLKITAVGDQQVEVEQSRFLTWALEGLEGPGVASWTIPTTFASLSGNATVQQDSRSWVVLQDRATNLAQPPASGSSWMLDMQGSGLFRVAYPEQHLLALAGNVQRLSGNSTGMVAAARLVDDTFSLLHQGHLSTASAFALADAVAASPAAASGAGMHLLWGTLLDNLNTVRHLLSPNQTCGEDLDDYVVRLTANSSSTILAGAANISGGWQGAPFLARLAQADVLREAALAGNAATAHALCAAYNASLAGTRIHPDLRGAAYVAAVAQPPGCQLGQVPATDAAEVFYSMTRRWQESEDIEESRRGLFAAAHTRLPGLVPTVLELALSPGAPLPSADRAAVLRLLLRRSATANAAWVYLYGHWPELSAGVDMWAVLDQVSLPPLPSMQEELQAMTASADPRSSTVTRIMGRLRHDISWLESTGGRMCSWLEQHVMRLG